MPGRGDRGSVPVWTNGQRCNVRHALPRHFLYPSLLLLLTEEPRHGYRLVDALVGLGFGPLDRPSVYRALADLESDGLLRSCTAAPTAGSTRYVYSVTERGTEVLDSWMALVGRQRDCLDEVLSRYTETSASGHRPPLAGSLAGDLAANTGGSRLNGGDPTH